MNELNQKQALEKRINHQMNVSISKKVLKILIVIALIITASYKGIDKLMTYCNYNPYKEETLITSSDSELPLDFCVLLEIFIKTYYPGYFGFVTEVEDLGFGKYDVGVCITEYLDKRAYPGLTNVVFHIENSKIASVETIDSTKYLFSKRIYEFDDPSTTEDNENFFEESNISSKFQDILEFPQSSYIDVSLSFSNFFSVEQLIDIIQTYEATYYWVAIENADQQGTYGISDGFCLYDMRGYELTDENQALYPDLITLLSDDKLTAEIIKQRYISQMQLFVDRTDFTNLFSSQYDFELHSDYFEMRLEKAKENINIYGLRITVKRDVLLEMMEELDLSYISINDVHLTTYSK